MWTKSTGAITKSIAVLKMLNLNVLNTADSVMILQLRRWLPDSKLPVRTFLILAVEYSKIELEFNAFICKYINTYYALLIILGWAKRDNKACQKISGRRGHLDAIRLRCERDTTCKGYQLAKDPRILRSKRAMICKDNVDVDGTGLRDKNGYTVYVKGTMFNIPTIRYIFTYA